MIKFDPIEERQLLDERVAGYARLLSHTIAEGRAYNALASYSSVFLNKAISCILVDYDEPAQRCLEKAHEWLTLAIAENERPREWEDNGFFESVRHHELALCNWLLHDRHDEVNFALSVANCEKFFNATGLGRDQEDVSLSLAMYLDAGAYGAAVARFAEAGIAAPMDLGSIQDEAQMCYVLCRQHGTYKPEHVTHALDQFLRRNVEQWLGRGHFSRAAEWMKIAHWQDGGALTANEAVLKCYDYLPGVIRPDGQK